MYGGTTNSLFSEIYDELLRQSPVKYPTTAEVKELERVQFIPITFSLSIGEHVHERLKESAA